MAPEIFDKPYKDGSVFRVSDSYLRTWLRDTLKWSLRRPTNTAQKLPENWEDLCEKSFFRTAYLIKEHDIPSSLILNSDQTQIVYAPGTGLTWEKRGSPQVSVVGVEEKRAFTLVVTLADDGTLVPFQGVYLGSSKRSLPDEDARGYEELTEIGCKFVSSGTDTYWSNQKTSQDLVTHIIVPYLRETKKRLGLPPNQKALWKLDLWAIHRFKIFRDWMAENYPDIILTYVPGGCTSKWQPCDVGVNRPLKHIVRRSFHEDMVSEYLEQIEVAKKKNVEVKSDRKLKHLRNNSWLWDAWQGVNDADLIKTVPIIAFRCWDSHSHAPFLLGLEKLSGKKMGSVV
jgi:hypothetical protein